MANAIAAPTWLFEGAFQWILAQESTKNKQLSILLGVGGTIIGASEDLGHDPQKLTKLAVTLRAHPVQYAHKLVSTRRALEKTYATNHHEDQERGTSSQPPDPHCSPHCSPHSADLFHFLWWSRTVRRPLVIPFPRLQSDQLID